MFRRLNGQAALSRLAVDEDGIELGRIPYWLAFEDGTGIEL